MTNPTPPAYPSQEALAQALATLSALIQAAPQQQAEHALMVEEATKVDHLDEQIKKLSEEKRQSVVVLLPLLHKLSGGKLTLGNQHEVLAAMSQEKRVTKKQIGAFLEAEFGAVDGKKKTEAFWKTVPSKTREYVTVKRPGEKAEESEDAEVPAPAATV